MTLEISILIGFDIQLLILAPPSYEATFPFTDKAAEAGGDLPSYGDVVRGGEKKEGDDDGARASAPFDPEFIPKYATYGYGWAPPSNQ
jgi:hypothetical protein